MIEQSASKTIEDYCGVKPELVREGYRDLSINFRVYIDHGDYDREIEQKDIKEALDAFFCENKIHCEVENEYLDKIRILKDEVHRLLKESVELEKYKNYFDLTKEINGVT